MKWVEKCFGRVKEVNQSHDESQNVTIFSGWNIFPTSSSPLRVPETGGGNYGNERRLMGSNQCGIICRDGRKGLNSDDVFVG